MMSSNAPSPRSFARAVSLALLLACAVTTPALADDGPKQGKAAAAPGADDQAAQWMAKGNKAFKEGRFADAESAYREAFDSKQGYDIAGNLGAAEMAQGKLKEAAQHLAFSLRLFPITGDPGLRERMTKALEQCQKDVGALHVSADPRGASIWIDGARSGESPLPDDVFVDPGDHTVEARLDGYTAAVQQVHVEKGNAAAVTLTLVPVVKQAPPVDPTPTVAPVKRRSLIPGLALGAVSVVGLAGGIAFISMSSSSKSEAEAMSQSIVGNHQSCVGGAGNYDAARCGPLNDKAKAYATYHNVAVGAFIAGGIAAAGTAAYFLWPSKRAGATGHDLRVAPVFGSRDGAVIVTGSF
ncbi:MAG: PEGA domain-containing protein [Minicystis sp.]